MRIYVVAGSTQEYERWLRGPATAYEGVTFSLLTEAQKIRTMDRKDRVVLLQGWKSRPDWRAVYNAMISTGRTALS